MKINDRELVEILSKATRGPWLVASNEDHKFYIAQKDSSPIRYIIRELPKMNNYDMRLMALARELAEEVLENRIMAQKQKPVRRADALP